MTLLDMRSPDINGGGDIRMHTKVLVRRCIVEGEASSLFPPAVDDDYFDAATACPLDFREFILVDTLSTLLTCITANEGTSVSILLISNKRKKRIAPHGMS